MTDDEMTIREMCDAFDVTPRTLRFYEPRNCCFPIREGQKRLFTRRDRARLKLILRGKRFGFSSRRSASFWTSITWATSRPRSLRRRYDVARGTPQDMERKRDELTAAVDDLREQMKWSRTCCPRPAPSKTPPNKRSHGRTLTCRATPPPPRTCSSSCTTC
jgi:hypothetical protein